MKPLRLTAMALLALTFLGGSRPNAAAPFAIDAELAADLPWLRTLCAPLWAELSPDCMAELDRVYLDRDAGRNLGFDAVAEAAASSFEGPQPPGSVTWREVFEDPRALRGTVRRAADNPQCQAKRGEAPHHLREACAADAFARLSVLHGACGRTRHWGLELVDQPNEWAAYWERAREHLDPTAEGRRDRLAALEESELHFAWRLRKCRGTVAARQRIVTVRKTPVQFRFRGQELELLVAAARLGSPWANARLDAWDPAGFADSDAVWPWAVAPRVVEVRTIRRRLAADGTLRWTYANGDEAWFDDHGVPTHWHSESGETETGSKTMLGKRQRPRSAAWVDDGGLSRWQDYDGVEHWIDADGAEHWIDFDGVEWVLLPPEVAPEALPRVAERTTGDYVGTEDLSATGDFDGDGQPDEAYFVRARGTYLLVLDRSGAEAPVFLGAEMTSVSRRGVRTLPPGEYTAFCADRFARRGTRDCPERELRELNTTHDAILRISFEAAAWIVYWDDGRLYELYYMD